MLRVVVVFGCFLDAVTAGRLARLAHFPSASLARSPALPSGAPLSLVMLLWLISFGKEREEEGVMSTWVEVKSWCGLVCVREAE